MPWEGARSTCSSSHATGWCRQLRAGPIHLAHSPSPLPTTAAASHRSQGREVCGARLSPPGVAGIKDTSSAFFFVFHLLRLFIASTVWGCTSRPAPLPAAPAELLSIPLTPGAAGEPDAAFGYGNAVRGWLIFSVCA